MMLDTAGIWLRRCDDNLVANLGIVIRQVDDKVSCQGSTGSVRYADDFHRGGISAASIQTSSRRLDRERWVRVGRKRGVIILEGHARRRDHDIDCTTFASRGNSEGVFTIRNRGRNEFHPRRNVGVNSDSSRNNGIRSKVFQTRKLWTVTIPTISLRSKHST